MVRSFVINLPQAAGRLEDFRRREKPTGLRSEVFPALSGRDLPKLPPHLPSLTAGEVGCFLSHRELLRKIATLSDEWVIVLEDDVRFWPDFGTRAQRALDDADQISAGFVQLGWGPTPLHPDRLALLRDRAAMLTLARRLAHAFRPDVRLKPLMVVGAPFGWGAHCYAVRPETATTAVDFLDGPRIHAPIDVYYPMLQRLYPAEFTRTRFSLAGQVWMGESTTVPGRNLPPYQTDATGRVVRIPRDGALSAH